AALQRAERAHRRRHAVALDRVEALERRDRATGDLVERYLARDGGLAVEQHGAAPALARGRAAVLRRRDAELVAQGAEQVRMGIVDGDLVAVQLEGGHGASGGGMTPRCDVMRPYISGRR